MKKIIIAGLLVFIGITSCIRNCPKTPSKEIFQFADINNMDDRVILATAD
jgi:hypothetical protein